MCPGVRPACDHCRAGGPLPGAGEAARGGLLVDAEPGRGELSLVLSPGILAPDWTAAGHVTRVPRSWRARAAGRRSTGWRAGTSWTSGWTGTTAA